MKLQIDLEAGEVSIPNANGGDTTYAMSSPEGFALVARAWLRAGWDAKYVYGFSWLGRPIIQLPEDMFRIQEVIERVRPTVIIETGVAHGGSLVFYASLFKAFGIGRVIGVDIEIRPHNRRAIEAHPLAGLITLVEGSSVEPATLAKVKSLVTPEDRVMVVLDSNHARAHVLEELRAYSPLVSKGSYLLVEDGIMRDLVGAPRSASDWATNNPCSAVRDFLAETNAFIQEIPTPPFNEGQVQEPVTYWPEGWLRRV